MNDIPQGRTALRDLEHLAELLRHWPKPLYAVEYYADGWVVAARWALDTAGADWAAVRLASGDILVVTDLDSLKDCPKAMPLPSAAWALAARLAAVCGPEAFELSPGWASAVRRLAALLDAAG